MDRQSFFNIRIVISNKNVVISLRINRAAKGLTIFLIKLKITCVGFWMEIGQKIFKFRPFLLLHLNWPFSEEKIKRSGKRSGLTIFLIKLKITCVGFWREIGQKIFKFRPFLLIDLKWSNFTDFGHLFLKKIHSWPIFFSCHIKVLDIPLLHAKLKKNLLVGTWLNLGPKMGPKNVLFPLLS